MATNRKHIKFNWALYQIDKLSKIDKEEHPADYDNVELIVRDYFEGSDLMFAWNEENGRHNGTLFIGQFNSGRHGEVQEKVYEYYDDDYPSCPYCGDGDMDPMTECPQCS